MREKKKTWSQLYILLSNEQAAAKAWVNKIKTYNVALLKKMKGILCPFHFFEDFIYPWKPCWNGSFGVKGCWPLVSGNKQFVWLIASSGVLCRVEAEMHCSSMLVIEGSWKKTCLFNPLVFTHTANRRRGRKNNFPGKLKLFLDILLFFCFSMWLPRLKNR